MPELPEVETIKWGLGEVLPGKQISDVEVRVPKLFQVAGPEGLQRVVGAKVKSIDRRGKLLMIKLSTGVTLLIHLKMTGQLIYRTKRKLVLAGGHPTSDMVKQMPVKSTHIIFHFKDGSELFFNDQRKFGYVRMLPDEDVAEFPLFKTFGPEPLDRSFTFAKFEERLRRRPSAKLKPLLLDQTFIAGLGNIYVDETLNLARLHPLRTVDSLTKPQRQELYKSIKLILRKALRYGGTSDSTYVKISGGTGDYLAHARAYHRTGQPCKRCGTPIERIEVAGRGTHYCPRCQKKPRPFTRRTK